MKTQTDRILRHLQSGRSLSPLQALRRYGCLRLAARCYDLRRAGVSIRSRIVRRGAKHYASYYYP